MIANIGTVQGLAVIRAVQEVIAAPHVLSTQGELMGSPIYGEQRVEGFSLRYIRVGGQMYLRHTKTRPMVSYSASIEVRLAL